MGGGRATEVWMLQLPYDVCCGDPTSDGPARTPLGNTPSTQCPLQDGQEIHVQHDGMRLTMPNGMTAYLTILDDVVVIIRHHHHQPQAQYWPL